MPWLSWEMLWKQCSMAFPWGVKELTDPQGQFSLSSVRDLYIYSPKPTTLFVVKVSESSLSSVFLPECVYFLVIEVNILKKYLVEVLFCRMSVWDNFKSDCMFTYYWGFEFFIKFDNVLWEESFQVFLLKYLKSCIHYLKYK